MHLSNQSLLVIIVVGIVAGYLAGRVMAGGGFGTAGRPRWCLHWRLAVAETWYSPRRRHGCADHQRVHWRRRASADPEVDRRWLGQTPLD